MFAVIDPNWGDPRPIPETIRDSEIEAWAAALRHDCPATTLYSGASEFPLPHGTRGSREKLEARGFRLARVHVEIVAPA